jgi:hypothetical protein
MRLAHPPVEPAPPIITYTIFIKTTELWTLPFTVNIWIFCTIILVYTGNMCCVCAVVHLRSCYSQEHVFLWEQWFIYGAAIHRSMCWCGSGGYFTELLFTGNMCWCGSSGSSTELLLSQDIQQLVWRHENEYLESNMKEVSVPLPRIWPCICLGLLMKSTNLNSDNVISAEIRSKHS